MTDMLDDAALDLLFREARSHRAWLDRPVSEAALRRIYDIAKMGPTSAKCSPMRIVFVRTEAGRKKLEPCLSSTNFENVKAAPVTAIIGYDLDFHEHFPTLFPFADARAWFTGNDALIESTAFRNGTLQGAYFILAARAAGLDCGPMSGFDNAAVDTAFFGDTKVRSNFICTLGHGDHSTLSDRPPRFGFDDVCGFA